MNRILALLCAFALGVAVHPYTEKEIVKLCSPSVVYIQTEGGSGTGFFINSQGYVLTCHHVVKDMKDIQVKYQGQAHKAELVSSYPDLDQAIVAIRLEGTPYVRVKENQDPNSVSLSDQVVVMGFPLGIEQLNVNGGKISAVYPDQKVDTIYQSDAVINPGNSGGPVFDMDGNAIAVVTSKIEKAENRNVSGMGLLHSIKKTVQQERLLFESIVAEKQKAMGSFVLVKGYGRVLEKESLSLLLLDTNRRIYLSYRVVIYGDYARPAKNDYYRIDKSPVGYKDVLLLEKWKKRTSTLDYSIDESKTIAGDSIVKKWESRFTLSADLLQLQRQVFKLNESELDRTKRELSAAQEDIKNFKAANAAFVEHTAALKSIIDAVSNDDLRRIMLELFFDSVSRWKLKT